MKLSMKKQDEFSDYLRKKIWDFLFYGVSEQEFLKMLGEIDLFYDVFLDSLFAYILSKPVTLEAKKRIYIYLQVFRNLDQNYFFPEIGNFKINQIFSVLASKEDFPTKEFWKEQIKMRYSLETNQAYQTCKRFSFSLARDFELFCACSENITEKTFQTYLPQFLLSHFTLDSIGIIYSECPTSFQDPIFMKRLFSILEQNYILLDKKEALSYLENDYEGQGLQIRNHEMIRKLEYIKDVQSREVNDK